MAVSAWGVLAAETGGGDPLIPARAESSAPPRAIIPLHPLNPPNLPGISSRQYVLLTRLNNTYFC